MTSHHDLVEESANVLATALVDVVGAVLTTALVDVVGTDRTSINQALLFSALAACSPSAAAELLKQLPNELRRPTATLAYSCVVDLINLDDVPLPLRPTVRLLIGELDR